jgi:hypothetical protein
MTTLEHQLQQAQCNTVLVSMPAKVPVSVIAMLEPGYDTDRHGSRESGTGGLNIRRRTCGSVFGVHESAICYKCEVELGLNLPSDAMRQPERKGQMMVGPRRTAACPG